MDFIIVDVVYPKVVAVLGSVPAAVYEPLVVVVLGALVVTVP